MKTNIYRSIKVFTAFVWFVNGLFCKVLNLVPRHQEIVARILGADHARLFTVIIGILEISMAAWILIGRWSRQNTLLQIMIVGTMNLLEAFLVPDLLLWGYGNGFFALVFMLLIYYNEFHLRKELCTI